MRPSPRTTARAALLALLALAVLLTAGCSVPQAGAQTGYPYPAPSATTATGPTATTPAGGPTATTPAGGPTATTPAGGPTATRPAGTAVAPTIAVTVVPRTPTPRPTGNLPNSAGGSFPILLGVVLLVLAGAVAVARRRLS